jgi:hypothetical protein
MEIGNVKYRQLILRLALAAFIVYALFVIAPFILKAAVSLAVFFEGSSIRPLHFTGISRIAVLIQSAGFQRSLLSSLYFFLSDVFLYAVLFFAAYLLSRFIGKARILFFILFALTIPVLAMPLAYGRAFAILCDSAHGFAAYLAHMAGYTPRSVFTNELSSHLALGAAKLPLYIFIMTGLAFVFSLIRKLRLSRAFRLAFILFPFFLILLSEHSAAVIHGISLALGRTPLASIAYLAYQSLIDSTPHAASILLLFRSMFYIILAVCAIIALAIRHPVPPSQASIMGAAHRNIGRAAAIIVFALAALILIVPGLWLIGASFTRPQRYAAAGPELLPRETIMTAYGDTAIPLYRHTPPTSRPPGTPWCGCMFDRDSQSAPPLIAGITGEFARYYRVGMEDGVYTAMEELAAGDIDFSRFNLSVEELPARIDYGGRSRLIYQDTGKGNLWIIRKENGERLVIMRVRPYPVTNAGRITMAYTAQPEKTCETAKANFAGFRQFHAPAVAKAHFRGGTYPVFTGKFNGRTTRIIRVSFMRLVRVEKMQWKKYSATLPFVGLRITLPFGARYTPSGPRAELTEEAFRREFSEMTRLSPIAGNYPKAFSAYFYPLGTKKNFAFLYPIFNTFIRIIPALFLALILILGSGFLLSRQSPTTRTAFSSALFVLYALTPLTIPGSFILLRAIGALDSMYAVYQFPLALFIAIPACAFVLNAAQRNRIDMRRAVLALSCGLSCVFFIQCASALLPFPSLAAVQAPANLTQAYAPASAILGGETPAQAALIVMNAIASYVFILPLAIGCYAALRKTRIVFR